jgi:hypothetical protein
MLCCFANYCLPGFLSALAINRKDFGINFASAADN